MWRSLNFLVLAGGVKLDGRFSPMSSSRWMVLGPSGFYERDWLDWIRFLQPPIFLICVYCCRFGVCFVFIVWDLVCALCF